MLSACFQFLVFAASMKGVIAASKLEESLMILDNLTLVIELVMIDFKVLLGVVMIWSWLNI